MVDVSPLQFSQADGSSEEGLLSRTFHRGFAAGQALSSVQFDNMLPWLVDEFVAAHRGSAEARRWADAFASFARRKRARLGIDVSYVSEGGGI